MKIWVTLLALIMSISFGGMTIHAADADKAPTQKKSSEKKRHKEKKGKRGDTGPKGEEQTGDAGQSGTSGGNHMKAPGHEGAGSQQPAQ